MTYNFSQDQLIVNEKIGIGIDQPEEALDVKGAISATEEITGKNFIIKTSETDKKDISNILQNLENKIKSLENKLNEQTQELVSVKKKLAFAESIFTEKSILIIDLNQGINLEIEFIYIPRGKFLMGGDQKEHEKPKHWVTIKPFLIAKTPVTQSQWQAVMGNNPSHFIGDDHPVENVSWYDCQEFCAKLNQKVEKNFRLPSEAEWEYACRATMQTEYYFGDDQDLLKDHAWYNANSSAKTHSVATKEPNLWGLYDMHGNIWEWCEDDWHNNYQGAPTNAVLWPGELSNLKVIRGGSWGSSAGSCRSASRVRLTSNYLDNDLGFRIVLSCEKNL